MLLLGMDGKEDMITATETYKGLTLDIIDVTTERITHGETVWHETVCGDVDNPPDMDRMRAMVDQWEADGALVQAWETDRAQRRSKFLASIAPNVPHEPLL